VNVFGVIAAAGAGLLAIGSFMPWVSVNVGMFGSISVNGMDGDGVLTLFAGVAAGVLLLLGALLGQKVLLLLGAIAGGGGGAVALYDLININNEISAFDDGMVSAQPGAGLFVCLTGGVVALVLGIVAATQSR
jgi:hypothetical protein